jgi:pyruvate dehydrogenase E1 component alpha subunit
MYTKMKIRGFLHLYIGEEAVAVGIMQALRKDDQVLSTYREHGHALARGIEPAVIMSEMYGKITGCCRGRGGSMHLFDVSKKFYGGNAIVAGHLPMAIGMALANKKLQNHTITCCFFGEGAMAEGEFHEAMNLAGLWQVPVLLVCENNQYAMGTALKYTLASVDLETKAAAYGIESMAVDGMDISAVYQAAKLATEKIRSTGKPIFLVCNTYRFRAHSMFDTELYREKSEVESWKKQDPISRFQEYALKEQLLTADELTWMDGVIEKEVQQAVDYAEAAGWESLEDMNRFVYSEKKKP